MASSPPTLIFASTGTLATSQVMLNNPQSCHESMEPFYVQVQVSCVYAFHFFFSGIDLAFIENGFIYHTKYDTADRILTDSIQRAGTQTSYTCICYLLLIIFYLTRIVNTFNASSLVAASVCQGESGHCSSGLEWLETAVDTISLSQTLTRAVHLCSIHRFQSGQHSADLIISLRTKKCMHTWQTQTFTVALALVYLVQLRMSNYFALLSSESSQSALQT